MYCSAAPRLPASPAKGRLRGYTALRWIIKGHRPAADTDPGKRRADTTHPALRSESSGAIAERLAAAIVPLVPSGSRRVSALQYPDAHAATVAFRTNDGVSLSVTVQQLSSPIYLPDITLDFPGDETQDWAGGTQAVIVNHALPSTLQIVLARPSGSLLTVSVSTGDDQRPSSDLMAPWRTSDDFVRLVQGTLNSAVADRIAS
jgi:hypothetical protein